MRYERTVRQSTRTSCERLADAPMVGKATLLRRCSRCAARLIQCHQGRDTNTDQRPYRGKPKKPVYFGYPITQLSQSTLESIMNKYLVSVTLVAATLAAPAVAFAQSNGPVTRAQVRADL